MRMNIVDIMRWQVTLLALLLTAAAGKAPCLPDVASDSRQQAKPAAPGKSTSAEEPRPYVIEHYDTSIRFEADGTSRRELRVRAHVLLDEGAEELSRLVFDYDRKTEQLEISDVEVHQASGGSIGILPHAVADRPVAAVRDAPAYQDAREKSVRIPGLKAGDSLQYTVTLAIVKPPAETEFWVEHNFLRDAPVNEQQLEVNIPRERAVRIKTRPGFESFTTTDDASGASQRRLYRWKIAHDGNAASASKPLADSTSSNSRGADEPDIQLSTFQTWEDLGLWYQKQWDNPHQRESREKVSAKVREIVRGLDTRNEQLAALYSFVAQKIRSIELSADAIGYRLLPPAQVLEQGYGSAADKHNLLAEMARTIGLRAIPVLVNSSRDVTQSIPSPSQFNQLVTAVEVNREWWWLDTTPEVAPFRMLAAGLRNKRGLAVRSSMDGTAGPEKLPMQWLTTPVDPPFAAKQRVTVSSEVSKEGKLTARVQYAVRGDTEMLLRVAFHRAPRTQWKNLGQLLAISDGFRGDVTRVTASDPADTEKPFEVEYQIAQNGVVNWKNQKAGLELPLPSFGFPDGPSGADTGKSGGTTFELGTPLTVTAIASVSFPEGLVVRAPVPVGVKRDYAEYHSNYQTQGNKITAKRELRFVLRELPSERSGDYSAFMRSVRRDEAQQITLEQPAPVAKVQATTLRSNFKR